jgi:Protein of unknown function (DUF4231)
MNARTSATISQRRGCGKTSLDGQSSSSLRSHTVESRITPAAPDDDLQSGHAWTRLIEQVGWYDGKSATSKRGYVSLKVVQLVGAALVPVVAGVHAAVWITGGLGALVVVVEGVQQLFQFEATWINYRSTAEDLNHEDLYLSMAGDYAGQADPKRLLAERVAALISQENTKGTSGRQQVLQAEQAAGKQGKGLDSRDGPKLRAWHGSPA